MSANGLLEEDAWTRLKSMASNLAAISLSLETAMEQQQQHSEGGEEAAAEAVGNRLVADAFRQLSEDFGERFKGFNSNGVVFGATAVGR